MKQHYIKIKINKNEMHASERMAAPHTAEHTVKSHITEYTVKTHTVEHTFRKARDAVNRAVKKLTGLLYPPRCPVCDEVLDMAQQQMFCCSECMKKLPRVKGPRCMKCGKPVARGEQEFCPDCERRQHEFDQGAAVFTYSGCMPSCIFRLKSSNRRDYIEFFAQELYRSSAVYLKRWRPQVIIPVPMHPRKKAARGYNQAELLAESLGELIGIPCDRQLLRCIKRTKVQKTLGQKARRQNLRGSFAVQKPVRGLERVLVIDDVYTTGSTMDEIAGILKKSGVRHVYFFVLCTGKGKNSVCMAEKV